ncbi:hypothetical protein AC579_1763 [Pseudocercospora musae]|uniref:Uncharacterized protein n=1 Tax=Pseudocercospora musae TaxID=113226 RepID=A0A139IP71_9PEZI|nr:hypothetical protein AC579_1763 [Pseudocercospora musae]
MPYCPREPQVQPFVLLQKCYSLQDANTLTDNLCALSIYWLTQGRHLSRDPKLHTAIETRHRRLFLDPRPGKKPDIPKPLQGRSWKTRQPPPTLQSFMKCGLHFFRKHYTTRACLSWTCPGRSAAEGSHSDCEMRTRMRQTSESSSLRAIVGQSYLEMKAYA